MISLVDKPFYKPERFGEFMYQGLGQGAKTPQAFLKAHELFACGLPAVCYSGYP